MIGLIEEAIETIVLKLAFKIKNQLRLITSIPANVLGRHLLHFGCEDFSCRRNDIGKAIAKLNFK
jgi:hypothetical protein